MKIGGIPIVIDEKLKNDTFCLTALRDKPSSDIGPRGIFDPTYGGTYDALDAANDHMRNRVAAAAASVVGSPGVPMPTATTLSPKVSELSKNRDRKKSRLNSLTHSSIILKGKIMRERVPLKQAMYQMLLQELQDEIKIRREAKADSPVHKVRAGDLTGVERALAGVITLMTPQQAQRVFGIPAHLFWDNVVTDPSLAPDQMVIESRNVNNQTIRTKTVALGTPPKWKVSIVPDYMKIV